MYYALPYCNTIDLIFPIFLPVKTCQNLSKLVKTCQNLSKLVKKIPHKTKEFHQMIRHSYPLNVGKHYVELQKLNQGWLMATGGDMCHILQIQKQMGVS